jgi:ABC-2 type transport system ATP-binding protein
VIVSTHILQEVEATCDRVLILRRGELALDARLEELTQSSGLLLSCDAQPAAALALLDSLEVVAAADLVEEQGGAFTYRLRPQSDRAATAAAIAAAMVKDGWQLYALQPEEHSLEKIFHDITAVEVTTDAA